MTERYAHDSMWANVIVAVLAAFGFAITYGVGVLTSVGQRAEQVVLDDSRFAYDQPLLNLITVPNLLVACVVIAGVALIRRKLSTAISALAIIGASTLLTQVLKHGVLERPAFVAIGDNTFPSGHMTAFAAVTFALVLVVPPRIRSMVAVLGALTLSTAGTLLLISGWHRPSDVLGSLLLVTCVSAVAQLGVADEHSTRQRVKGVRVLAAIAVLVGALAVISLALISFPFWPDAWPSSPMLAAQLGTVAAVLLSMAAMLFLSRRGMISARTAA